jgi:hypothetical protein
MTRQGTYHHVPEPDCHDPRNHNLQSAAANSGMARAAGMQLTIPSRFGFSITCQRHEYESPEKTSLKLPDEFASVPDPSLEAPEQAFPSAGWGSGAGRPLLLSPPVIFHSAVPLIEVCLIAI